MNDKDSIVGPLVGSLYVQSHFSDEDKSAVKDMVNEIRNTFPKILDNLEWMDDATRAEAKEKALAMEDYVGYPDDLLNTNKLTEHFSKLEIGDDYFQNQVNMQKFEMNNVFSKLRYIEFRII